MKTSGGQDSMRLTSAGRGLLPVTTSAAVARHGSIAAVPGYGVALV